MSTHCYALNTLAPPWRSRNYLPVSDYCYFTRVLGSDVSSINQKSHGHLNLYPHVSLGLGDSGFGHPGPMS